MASHTVGRVRGSWVENKTVPFTNGENRARTISGHIGKTVIPVQVDVCAVLFETLRELGAQKPFNKLTVKDICQAASVSKRTFYNHFQDKYDLAAWGYRRGVRASIEGPGPCFRGQQFAALATISNHGAYLDGLFEMTSGVDSFRRALRDVNREVYGELARKLMGSSRALARSSCLMSFSAVSVRRILPGGVMVCLFRPRTWPSGPRRPFPHR